MSDFSLGGLTVRPSRGEVHGAGLPERLEPRVMQALVALAIANGSTLSRQDLIEQCWGGVVVGRDAVNRVVSILRGLSARMNGAFQIETRPRIGYRLISVGSGAGEVSTAINVRLVAVLPFDGEGEASGLLAEGMSEAILSGLTRNGGIVVAARHSSFQFRGPRKVDAPSALGASHMVDGSVVVDGERVRVTACLIDAERGVTLWSEQFDGVLSNIFEVEDRIATQIVQTLNVRLGRRRSVAPANPVAYDLYTRALVALEQPAREPVEQALAYLKEVTLLSPKFASGWAGLAEALRRRMLYRPPHLQEPERFESQHAAERALELDPHLGQAYGTLADLLPRFGRWREVEELFERGLAITPESPELRHQHSRFLIATGRGRDGLAALLALNRVNPLSASVSVELASALFDCGRDAEAMTAIDRAYALWPAIMMVWSERVRLHVIAGNYGIVEGMLNEPPPTIAENDPNIARRRLHMIARRDRRPADLAGATANFQAFAQNGGAPAVVAIHALTTLWQDAEALGVADQIFRRQAAPALRPGVNMMGTYWLAGEPDSTVLFRRDTASLRSSAGFEAILRRIGLDEYWMQNALVPDYRQASMAGGDLRGAGGTSIAG